MIVRITIFLAMDKLANENIGDSYEERKTIGEKGSLNDTMR
jgi:hypothetical protein